MSNAKRYAALQNARLENHAAKVQACLNAALATERSELAVNERNGSHMAIANRNAIRDLVARGAK